MSRKRFVSLLTESLNRFDDYSIAAHRKSIIEEFLARPGFNWKSGEEQIFLRKTT